jgi:hypothetical protein
MSLDPHPVEVVATAYLCKRCTRRWTARTYPSRPQGAHAARRARNAPRVWRGQMLTMGCRVPGCHSRSRSVPASAGGSSSSQRTAQYRSQRCTGTCPPQPQTLADCRDPDFDHVARALRYHPSTPFATIFETGCMACRFHWNDRDGRAGASPASGRASGGTPQAAAWEPWGTSTTSPRREALPYSAGSDAGVDSSLAARPAMPEATAAAAANAAATAHGRERKGHAAGETGSRKRKRQQHAVAAVFDCAIGTPAATAAAATAAATTAAITAAEDHSRGDSPTRQGHRSPRHPHRDHQE